jgi:hypothetical protein
MNHTIAAQSTLERIGDAVGAPLTLTHRRIDRILMTATLVLAAVTATVLIFTSGHPRQFLGGVLLALMTVLVVALSRPPSTVGRADTEIDEDERSGADDDRATSKLAERGVRKLAAYLERHAEFAEYLEQQHGRRPTDTARRRRRFRPR